jgi:hypothetical protein
MLVAAASVSLGAKRALLVVEMTPDMVQYCSVCVCGGGGGSQYVSHCSVVILCIQNCSFAFGTAADVASGFLCLTWSQLGLDEWVHARHNQVFI